jgi:hypothetical protein
MSSNFINTNFCIFLFEKGNHNLSLFSRTNTNRVSKRYFITAHIQKLLGNCINFLRRNLSVVRTTHYCWNISSYFNVVHFCHFNYFLKSFKTFFNWTIYIFLSKLLTSCSKNSNFFYTTFQCGFHTFFIRHLNWITDSWKLINAHKQLLVIFELRNSFWWHERSSFYSSKTCIWQFVY